MCGSLSAQTMDQVIDGVLQGYQDKGMPHYDLTEEAVEDIHKITRYTRKTLATCISVRIFRRG